MTMITQEVLDHITWLCRIELKEEEKKKYAQKLNSVLEYFEKLDEVGTENVEPTYHVLSLNNVFREDEKGNPTASLSQEEALSNAPKTQNGYFKAPRMM